MKKLQFFEVDFFFHVITCSSSSQETPLHCRDLVTVRLECEHSAFGAVRSLVQQCRNDMGAGWFIS